MSEFPSLLGKLRESACRVRKADDTDKQQLPNKAHHKRSQRRDAISDANVHRQYPLASPAKHLPLDSAQLSVNISFLCIGAQKSGTSWLHEMLRFHPKLCLPEIKEVHFWDWNRHKGLAWYSNQFGLDKRKSYQDCYVGEITPCYIVLPEKYIQEIHLLFPACKLIFIARDIMDRAWSAMLMELRNATFGIQAGLFEGQSAVDNVAVEKYEAMADSDNYDDDYFMQRLEHSTHTKRCNYAEALRKWLKYFPSNQLLIVDYRELSLNPRKALADVCSHIGVDVGELWNRIDETQLTRRVNAATGSNANRAIRPTLRIRMENYLAPFSKDFNCLLDELNYCWRLQEYGTQMAVTESIEKNM